MIRAILDQPVARVGAICVVVVALVAGVGPWLVVDPDALVARPLQPPSWAHWLGTTGQGQDVLAQTVCGAGGTLAIGLGTGLVVLVVGGAVGLTAGVVGGWVDEALSLAIQVFLVLPGLPLMVVLAAWLPPGPWTMLAVLGVTSWAWTARVVRAATLPYRAQDFVAAARLAGEPTWRIVLVEILPHHASLLASAFIGATVYAIGASVGLEFLGLGDLDRVTWGTNLYWATNDAALLTGSWWTFVPTGVAVALTGFGLVLLQTAVDEVSNPRLRAERQSARVVGSRWNGVTPVVRR